jgi:two-component system response regulator DevR
MWWTTWATSATTSELPCLAGVPDVHIMGVARTGPSALGRPRTARYEEQMIRVFLLDDHEVVRRGLTDLLHAAGDIEVVGESGSAQEATRRIPALRPDVAVLDARLPDGNGIDVCRDIRAVDSTIKGLILTSYEDDEALFAAIMAGASGYVLKQIRGTDLVDAVRRVAAGQSLLDPAVTQRVLERIRNGVEQPRELASLTDQERRILEHVAGGLTNREIAAKMFLAEKTVKNYVSSLLNKLGLERRTQAAVLATKLLGEHSAPHP